MYSKYILKHPLLSIVFLEIFPVLDFNTTFNYTADYSNGVNRKMFSYHFSFLLIIIHEPHTSRITSLLRISINIRACNSTFKNHEMKFNSEIHFSIIKNTKHI